MRMRMRTGKGGRGEEKKEEEKEDEKYNEKIYHVTQRRLPATRVRILC